MKLRPSSDGINLSHDDTHTQFMEEDTLLLKLSISKEAV